MKNISKDTIIRTVLLIVSFINLILNACGKNTLPFTSDEISEAISVIFTIAASLAAWWKNNSFTTNAQLADLFKKNLSIGGEGEILYYNQNNYSNIPYAYNGNGKTVKTSGCGVCTAAMVFNTYAGKELYTISQMAKFSLNAGARDNSGTNMLTLLKALCQSNPDFLFTTTNDENELVKHLKSGGMAICNQGDVYNVFSTNGHYVVASGMNGNNITVCDPQLYDGKYDAYERPKRIVAKTSTGCVVSPTEMGKAMQDRNPAYYLVTYSPTKKPVYNAGSKYKLTSAVNVWTKPSTTEGRILKVRECTIDGQKSCTSTNKDANATFATGTVFSCQAVIEDSKTGYIWARCPSGWLPVYYKGKKRANWYNK